MNRYVRFSLLLGILGGFLLWTVIAIFRNLSQDAELRTRASAGIERGDTSRAVRMAEGGSSVDSGASTPESQEISKRLNRAWKANRPVAERYEAQANYQRLQNDIRALPEATQRDALLRTLAYYQAQEGFQEEALQTVDAIENRELRVGFLIAAGSEFFKERESARRPLLMAQIEIAQITEPSQRDALYAQLAFAYNMRGLKEDQQLICNRIALPRYKTSTCP
jgi:hypothetical protein